MAETQVNGVQCLGDDELSYNNISYRSVDDFKEDWLKSLDPSNVQ